MSQQSRPNSTSSPPRVATVVRHYLLGSAAGIALGLAVALGTAACGNDSGPSNQPTTPGPLAFAITISDNKFTPSSLTVPVGTTVAWDWTGNNMHAVQGTFDGTPVTSPTHEGSGSFRFTFTKSGTYDYHCAIHGAAMAARIVVK